METLTTSQKIIQFILKNKALILLILLSVVSSLLSPYFLTKNNLFNLVKQTCVLAILAIGFTLLLSSGSMDLSVGNLMALVGVCMATFDAKFGWPAIVVIILGFIIGIGGLALNTTMCQVFQLNGFILSLAMSMVFKGLLWVISGGQSVPNLSPWAKFFGQGYILGIPVQFYAIVALFVFMLLLLRNTKFGRHALAMGGNFKAATVCGVDTKKLRYKIAVIMGVCVTIAALITNGRNASAQLNAGADASMDCIAAVVMGGTPMSGGVANVPGTLIGCLLIQMIANVMNLFNLNSNWHQVAKGVMIIVAIILDVQGQRIIDRFRAKSMIKE